MINNDNVYFIRVSLFGKYQGKPMGCQGKNSEQT